MRRINSMAIYLIKYLPTQTVGKYSYLFIWLSSSIFVACNGQNVFISNISYFPVFQQCSTLFNTVHSSVFCSVSKTLSFKAGIFDAIEEKVLIRCKSPSFFFTLSNMIIAIEDVHLIIFLLRSFAFSQVTWAKYQFPFLECPS